MISTARIGSPSAAVTWTPVPWPIANSGHLAVGHRQAPLLGLVRLVPAARRCPAGAGTPAACSGPVTRESTWNSHAVSGVVDGRGCALTRNSDTSQCPSCRRARPRSTTCGWSAVQLFRPQPALGQGDAWLDPCTG